MVYIAFVQENGVMASRLRELRIAADLSMEGLAARAGISTTTIWRIERGKALHPKYSVLAKIGRALGFASVEDLMGDGLAQVRAASWTTNVVGSVDELRPVGTGLLPVYGWGACGDPRDRENAPSPVARTYPPVGKEALIGPNGFGVLVDGESMANRNIHTGDTVWVNPQEAPRVGRVVYAQAEGLDGEHLGNVIKVWQRKDGIEGLWGDGEGDEGRNPLVCRRFEIIGPVVWVTRGHAPG